MATLTGHLMSCMEVWGGNRAANNGVSMPGLDAWVHSEPYEGDASGGDVHYVSSCATGRITRFLVADVSGHGAAVSTIATRLQGLMRRYVNYLDQTRFVQALNREFSQHTEAGGFATAVALTYFSPTGVLVACNAGHPRPLWYRSRQKQWGYLRDRREEADQRLSNLPLGIIEPTEYGQFGVRLRRGDLVLLYTDSLIEAASEGAEPLGENGLLALMAELDADRPETLIPALLARISERVGGNGFQDDETVLLLRDNGYRPRLTLGDRVTMLRGLTGMLLRSLTPGGGRMAWPELRVENIGGALFNTLNDRWGGRPPD